MEIFLGNALESSDTSSRIKRCKLASVQETELVETLQAGIDFHVGIHYQYQPGTIKASNSCHMLMSCDLTIVYNYSVAYFN